MLRDVREKEKEGVAYQMLRVLLEDSVRFCPVAGEGVLCTSVRLSAVSSVLRYSLGCPAPWRATARIGHCTRRGSRRETGLRTKRASTDA